MRKGWLAKLSMTGEKATDELFDDIMASDHPDPDVDDTTTASRKNLIRSSSKSRQLNTYICKRNDAPFSQRISKSIRPT